MGLLGQRRADRRDFDIEHIVIIYVSLLLLAFDVMQSESQAFDKQSYTVNK
jgi:hypothetical protein